MVVNRKEITTMAYSIDNHIRRLNKRLEDVQSSIGVGSNYYSSMKRAITLIIKNKKLIKRENGKIAIKRSKNSGITKDQLDRIEEMFNRTSLVKEKRKIREFAKKAYGEKVKGVRRYKEIARYLHDMSARIDEIFDWFYAHRNDPVCEQKREEFDKQIRTRDYYNFHVAIEQAQAFIDSYHGHANASAFNY